MARRKATLRTLALATGFSVTTVSRALKDAPELSAETKRLVREAADAYGYVPDLAARRLRMGRTFVVCFVLGQEDETNRIARNVILGISNGLRGTPYQLIIVPQFRDEEAITPVRYVVETNAADGLILSHTTPQDERVKYLSERNIPFVTHGRTELVTPHAFYDYDNHSFALEATRRLIARGRRRIVLIPPVARFTYAGLQIEGYRRAMREHGLEPVVISELSIESDLDLIRRLALTAARSDDPPDGYVCGGEECAIALLGGLQAAGQALARDVDIVCKQTSGLVEVLSPGFQTMREDFAKAGQSLARLLLRRLAGEAPETLQELEVPDWRPAREDQPLPTA